MLDMDLSFLAIRPNLCILGVARDESLQMVEEEQSLSQCTNKTYWIWRPEVCPLAGRKATKWHVRAV